VSFNLKIGASTAAIITKPSIIRNLRQCFAVFTGVSDVKVSLFTMIDYPSEAVTYFSKHDTVNSAPSPVPDDDRRRRAAAAANVSSVSTLHIEVEPLASIVDPLGNGATLISDISARAANITAKLRSLSDANFSADPSMAPFILDITQALGANITISFDASSIAVLLPSERMMPAIQSTSINNSSLSMGAIIGITLGVILLSSGIVGKVIYDAHSAKSTRAAAAAAAADIVAAMKEPQVSTISAAPSPLPDSATPGLVLRLHAPTRRVRRIPSTVTFPKRTKSIASIVPIDDDDDNTVIAIESPVRRRASKPDEVKPEEPTPRPRIMSFNGESSLVFHTDSNSPGEASLPGMSQAQDHDSRDDTTTTTTKTTIAETTAWVNELIATYAAAKPLPPRRPLSPTPLPGLEAADFVANLIQTSTSARARWTVPARQAAVPPEIVVASTPRSPIETDAREVVGGAFFTPRTREPLGTLATLSPLPPPQYQQLERRLSSKTLKWMASPSSPVMIQATPLCISPPTARASIRSPSAMDAILQLPTPVRVPPPECDSSGSSSASDASELSPIFTRSTLQSTPAADALKQNLSDAAQTAIARTLNIFRTHWPIQPAPPSSNGSLHSLHGGATPMDTADSPLSPYPMPPEGRPRSSACIDGTTAVNTSSHHPARLVVPQFAGGAHRTLTRLTMRSSSGGVSLPPGPPPGRPKTPLSVEVFRSSLIATSARSSADARAQAAAAATVAASVSPTHPFAATMAIYSAPVAPLVRIKLPPRGLSLSGPGIDRADSLVGRRVRRRDGSDSSPGSIASLARTHRHHHDSSPDSAASPGFIEASAPRAPISVTRPLHITRLTRLSRWDTTFNNGSTPVVENAVASNIVVDAAASRSSSRGLALHPPVGAMRLNLEKLLRVVDGNDTNGRPRDPVPTAETIESDALLSSLQATLDATRIAREKSARESKD
jgi:hypothetical protein